MEFFLDHLSLFLQGYIGNEHICTSCHYIYTTLNRHHNSFHSFSNTAYIHEVLVIVSTNLLESSQCIDLTLDIPTLSKNMCRRRILYKP